MGMVGHIRLGWKKSVSADVVKQTIIVVNDGTTTTLDFGPEVEEYLLDVAASKACSFSIDTFDSEGLKTTSAVYAFTLGDLTAPQPATDLFHEVLSVSDDGAPTPTPPGGALKPKAPK